jgi:hypothetical protein
MEQHTSAHPRPFALRDLFFPATVLVALFLAFLYLRINLMLPESADPDEGVYLMVARLLNVGYGYNTFYFDQFWLFPQIVATAFRLFGDSAETGRLTVVAFSLFGLLGMALLARQIGFQWAAPLGIVLGVVNHYYLAQSRYAMTDVPSAALMLWSLVCVLQFTARKQRVWLALGGAFCAASLLIKPLAVGFAVPLAIWILAARIERAQTRWHVAWRALVLDGVAFGAGGILLAAPFVDLFDLRGEFIRTVGFHWDEKDWYAPQLALRQLALVSFASENRMWFGLAGLGAVVAVLKNPLRALPLLAAEWLSVMVLVQLPPWWHHYALLAPLLSMFAAIGVCEGAAMVGRTLQTWLRRNTSARRVSAYPALMGAAFFFGVALWLHDAPQLVRYNLAVLNEPGHDTTPVVRYLDKNFERRTFLLSDNPMVLYLADMLIPPSAINLPYESTFRFSKLSEDKLSESVTNYNVAAIVVTGSYKHNAKLMAWIQQHFPTSIYVGTGKSDTVEAHIYLPETLERSVMTDPSTPDAPSETDAPPQTQ